MHIVYSLQLHACTETLISFCGLLQRKPWWRQQSHLLDQRHCEAEAGDKVGVGVVVVGARVTGGPNAWRKSSLRRACQSQFHFYTSPSCRGVMLGGGREGGNFEVLCPHVRDLSSWYPLNYLTVCEPSLCGGSVKYCE